MGKTGASFYFRESMSLLSGRQGQRGGTMGGQWKAAAAKGIWDVLREDYGGGTEGRKEGGTVC